MKYHSTILLRVLFVLLIIGTLSNCAASRRKRDRISTVIKTARSYTGTPYRYGGTSRSGIDCSGLLVRSFEAAGMSLPRTSKDQSKIGHEVSINELRPGDLVFFAAGRVKWKITHVGLVTDVRDLENIRFIHASSSKGVMEANLMSNYYRKIYRAARRPKYRKY